MPTKASIAPTTYKWGFHDEIKPIYKSPKGLSQKVVESISHYKNEPAWMREFRLRALKIFLAKPMPTWGADLSSINFDNIYYYIKPTEATMHSWDEVPDRIKATFDKLGIPQAEQKYLAGVGSQYDSENVYHNLRESLAKQGVIFCDVETALKEHQELVRKYFATIIPPGDNKFAALNSAVWSGGSFIYVPPGVRVEQPLQTYFRINAKNMGQFERTLIIVDEGAFVHYIEGCSAPIYATSSLHTAVVEIIALRGARVRYTTVQNWSNDVYNLVTKRAFAHEDAVVEWVDFNMGCLAGDSKIYVYNKGIVDIKNVKQGDEVYSANLDTLIPVKKKVVAVKDNGIKPTYKLITMDHREIVATDNHPFLALEPGDVGRSSRYLQWRHLKDLKEGDYIAVADGLPDVRNKCPKWENRIEFVKIREVVPDKQQKVYDLEIEGTHNFIANGIVVHNSKITMKYPGVYMVGRGARADILSMAYAGAGQHLDAGGKAVHLASDTSSRVISKSVSHGGGRTSYRGLLRVGKGARGVKSKVQCDALILDPASRSDTYPVMKIEEDDATIEHEATVSKIGEEQLFYLMSRGLSADEAALMIVNGFIEPLVKELPLEYAVEMNRMIALEMEGSVG